MNNWDIELEYLYNEKRQKNRRDSMLNRLEWRRKRETFSSVHNQHQNPMNTADWSSASFAFRSERNDWLTKWTNSKTTYFIFKVKGTDNRFVSCRFVFYLQNSMASSVRQTNSQTLFLSYIETNWWIGTDSCRDHRCCWTNRLFIDPADFQRWCFWQRSSLFFVFFSFEEFKIRYF